MNYMEQRYSRVDVEDGVSIEVRVSHGYSLFYLLSDSLEVDQDYYDVIHNGFQVESVQSENFHIDRQYLPLRYLIMSNFFIKDMIYEDRNVEQYIIEV